MPRSLSPARLVEKLVLMSLFRVKMYLRHFLFRDSLRTLVISSNYKNAFFPLNRLLKESENAKRKRLYLQSRKFGIKECDLLLGTFAEKYLENMNYTEMVAYDRIINAASMNNFTFTLFLHFLLISSKTSILSYVKI